MCVLWESVVSFYCRFQRLNFGHHDGLERDFAPLSHLASICTMGQVETFIYNPRYVFGHAHTCTHKDIENSVLCKKPILENVCVYNSSVLEEWTFENNPNTMFVVKFSTAINK